ncbi:MAG: hypothetical protein WD929_03330 [Steroidobacteraceae bacterium]
MPTRLQRFLLLLAIAALAGPAWAQDGALTVPRNLDQLVNRSAVILRGNVVSARFEEHPELRGLDTVVVTMRVREALKGQAGQTFTFRQHVWDLHNRVNPGGYHKGQDLLLLMIAPSRYGLSSPAGLDQGRFQVTRDSTSRETAINGQGNQQLFDGMSAQFAKQGVALSPASSRLVAAQNRGPVEVTELTALIRELVTRSR